MPHAMNLLRRLLAKPRPAPPARQLPDYLRRHQQAQTEGQFGR